MLLRYIQKVLRSPITVSAMFAVRFLWPQGVHYGPALTLVGMPEIRMTPGGEIKLGKKVTLFSRRRSNPLQLNSPIIKQLDSAEAET